MCEQNCVGKVITACKWCCTQCEGKIKAPIVECVHCAGCWESSGKEDCGSEACIPSQKQTKALNNTKFCCCTEDLCNMNHTELPYQTDYEESKDGSTNSTPPCQYYSYFYVNLFYTSVWKYN